MMTRRQMLAAAGGIAAATAGEVSASDVVPNPQGNRGLGVAPAGFGQRVRANQQAKIDMIDWAHQNGYGGIETRQPPTDPAEIKKLREKIESYNMRVIMGAPLPRTEADLPAFDASVKAAREIGAFGLHAAMTPRRYEQFDNFADFKKSFEQNQKTIALAEPTLARYKVRLAIENHKGWRAAEQAAWMKRMSSPYVGVHLDFGNNVSLCELPNDTMNVLLPYTFSCHIKDMAVEPYEDGFLLSEVPLGDGFLDLKGMVATLRKKDPAMAFDLEMITREPLQIPVFTDKYWVTFDDSYSPLPARDLARTLALVRKNPPKKPVPHTAGLSPADALKLEDDNNRYSLEYARKYLDL